MATWDKIKAIAATLVGGVGGALAGGPIGLGIGGIGGAIIDYARVKLGGPSPALIPGLTGASLPPGANIDAANRAVTLMLLAASTGHTTQAAPAKSWLTQFQSSVGLPATGSLDPQTRSLLVTAVPGAAQLPPVTILG